MRPRTYLGWVLLKIGWFFLRIGRFVSSLPLMVMRPDDLLESNRRHYADAKTVEYWASDEVITGGLTPLEKMLLGKTNLSQGKVLVLGMGGGREVIALAKMGFSVTGLDYVREAVEIAKENAAKHCVQFDALVGDFSFMSIAPADFDLVLFSSRMYSTIPTRRRRLGLLNKVYKALKPGGWFICMFWWSPDLSFSPQVEQMRKLFAYLSRGNLWYEPGDKLVESVFVHAFRDADELASEFAEGGFALTHLHIPEKGDTKGIALLHKPK